MSHGCCWPVVTLSYSVFSARVVNVPTSPRHPSLEHIRYRVSYANCLRLGEWGPLNVLHCGFSRVSFTLVRW